MALTYSGTGTTGTWFSAGSAQSPNMPTHAVGDLLILNAINRGDGGFTGPAGWTLIASASGGSGNQTFAVSMWYKIATSTSETATYTPGSGSNGMGGGGHTVSCISGADQTTPIIEVNSGTYIQTATGYGAQTFGGITAGRDGSWRAVSAGYWSQDTGYTREYAQPDARKNALSFQWKSVNAGATGTSSHNPAPDDSDGSINDEVQGVIYFIIQPPVSRRAVRFSFGF